MVSLLAAVVLIYPLLVGQGAPADSGTKISEAVATAMTRYGDVNVKAATDGIDQHDYLKTARGLGADYYLSGFVSALGDQLSVVEQLVSARTGSIIWSTTTRLVYNSEVEGLASVLHQAIMQYSERAYFVKSPVTPPPSSSPKPKPGPVALTKTATILAFAGRADRAVRDYVPLAVARTAEKYGVASESSEVNSSNSSFAGKDGSTRIRLFCATTERSMVLGGTVDTANLDPVAGGGSVVSLTLVGYDCTQEAKERSVTVRIAAGDLRTAVDIAVDRALRGYMQR